MQYLAFGMVSRERHSRMYCLHIQAWASALPSDIDKAMREASNCRTVTGTDSYAFPFKQTANEGMTAALTTKMSICIFVKGKANRGKSNAICKLAQLLNVPPTAWKKGGKEVDVILNKYGKMIGLHSEGDPGCGSIDWIKDAILQKGCDIVVVACRTGGSTQDPAISLLTPKGVEFIEIYPIRKPNDCYSDAEIELFSASTSLSLLHLIANL